MAWLRLVAALIVGVACLQVDQDGKNVIVGLAYLGGWRLVGAGSLQGSLESQEANDGRAGAQSSTGRLVASPRSIVLAMGMAVYRRGS